jgi:hypothetical protein
VESEDPFLRGWIFKLAIEGEGENDLFRDALHGEGAVRDEVSGVLFLDVVAYECDGGEFSMSKNAALRRSLSRSAIPVSMLTMRMVALMDDFAMSAAS